MRPFSFRILLSGLWLAGFLTVGLEVFWLSHSYQAERNRLQAGIASSLSGVSSQVSAEMHVNKEIESQNGDNGSDHSEVIVLGGEHTSSDLTIGSASVVLHTESSPALKVEIRKDLRGDLDPAHLDTLLRNGLLNVLPGVQFEFAVFNSAGAVEIGSDMSSNDPETMLCKGFKHAMSLPSWGNEMFDICVYYPNLTGAILQSSSLRTAVSLVVVLIILSSLLIAGFGLARQRKFARSKNDFINNMTHELKTPISTIRLACEALSDSSMSSGEESRKTYVAMINEENKRLEILVENVLRTAHLDQGEIRLKSAKVNMHEVISEVLNNLAIQIRKAGGTVKLVADAHDPIVNGDRVHLTNMVYNMLDNAMKYSSGSPEVMITTSNDAGVLQLTFADKGIGISKEHHAKIFDKLYRVPTGDVHNVKGFGLGLSYVKVIVDRHHGSIRLDSELAKGSKFIIQLPLQT